MEISERLLNDAGGWQVMKQARHLHETGRVLAVTWAEPLLQGTVREGETEFRSGLRIESKTRIDNLCSCRPARQHGIICAHSIALGLEWLRPGARAAALAATAPSASVAIASAISAPATKPERPAFSESEGIPAALHVILPPNFTAAWDRGQMTVGIEAELSGKRLLLTALDPAKTYHVSSQDLRLVQKLRQLSGGPLPGVLALTREWMLGLLEALPGNPRVTFGKSTAAAVALEGLRPELRVEQGSTGDLHLGPATLPPKSTLLRAGSLAPWLLAAGGTSLQAVAPGLPGPYHDLLEREIVVPTAGAAAFLQRELPLLQASFTIGALPKGLAVTAESPRPGIAGVAVGFELELEGSLNFLSAKLFARYGSHRLTLTNRPAQTVFARDPAAEMEAARKLQAAGFSPPDAEGQMTLKGENRILTFFARELPRWEKTAVVTIGERFQHVTRDVQRLQPRLEIRGSGEGWFDLQLDLSAEKGESFSGAEIQRLLQSGQSYVRNRQGQITVFDAEMVDELQQTLRDCEPNQRQPGAYRVDARQAAYLHGMAEEHGAEIRAPQPWHEAAQALLGGLAPPPVEVGDLAATLRPYQRQGVEWMSQLAHRRLAGILADEMGLGKTLQALALLRSLGGRALIVCPSSLVYNWEREAARFTPERRVLAIQGPDRRASFGTPLREAHLVITSYALLRRDAEHYRGLEFTAAILDEAQHIKNPETQNAQAAFAIRSQHRFVLTGTPVENSVRDIWSLMHFLMPGYLGKHEDFRVRYEKPIAAQLGGPEQLRLGKRLRPFILRRRKKDVITELPDKIEQVAYCELTGSQRELYAKLLSATKRQVSELSGVEDRNKSRILMLTALLRLRQACCDPRLLKLEEVESTAEDSAKLEIFGELLQEILDGGHRVLVFSQFVGMLTLLREWLEAQGVEYCYLDGSTKNRGAEVDRFQVGSAPVFLISLKAGGVGLNLTAADTVIHFDPWWNPAVEAQATDRAHRIGQNKVVTAYKLIARDTVEEKILKLQQKKRQVIEATIESEEPIMEGLTADDLRDLLE